MYIYIYRLQAEQLNNLTIFKGKAEVMKFNAFFKQIRNKILKQKYKNMIRNNSISIYAFILSMFLLITILPVIAIADEDRTWNIVGVPVTGANDSCGEPIWKMPVPFPPNLHFATLGVFNPLPGATDAIPLSVESCTDNALLATHTNKSLNALVGYEDADPRVTNIPLRQVKIKGTPDGIRMTLPSIKDTEGNPFPPVKSEPDFPITVGDWYKARGKMKIKCTVDGVSTIQASFTNLIPNGVYSMIATWKTIQADKTFPTFAALAFGGVPSIVVANGKGKASFKRELSHCPFDITPDGSLLMFVDLGYHMDGATNGVSPSSFFQRDKFLSDNGDIFESTKPPGTVVTPAVGFPINVEANTKM